MLRKNNKIVINIQKMTQQIERIKQENRDRENRLQKELESQRGLNRQKIYQERKNIQNGLNSVKQSSLERINFAQQQIDNVEKNFENQIQQQTNLSRILVLLIIEI